MCGKISFYLKWHCHFWQLKAETFCFIEKILFFLKTFNLFCWHFRSCRKTARRNLILISKFMASETGQQIIVVIHILPNISKTSARTCAKTSPRSFSKKSKPSTSLYQQSKVWHSLFLLYVQANGYQKILTLMSRPFAFTSKLQPWS